MGKTYKVSVENVSAMIMNNLRGRISKSGSIVEREWALAARAALGGARGNRYAQGISVLSGNSVHHAKIALIGFYPNMIEQGLGPQGIGSEGPFDIKEVILKNKDDVNVPFRHTAGSITRAAGATVAKHARSLQSRPLVEAKDTKTRGMQRLGGGGRMSAKVAERARAKHLLGMVHQTYQRQLKSGKLKTESTYTTFRRAKRYNKDGVRLPRWVHPGVKGRRLAVWALRFALTKIMGTIRGGHV